MEIEKENIQDQNLTTEEIKADATPEGAGSEGINNQQGEQPKTADGGESEKLKAEVEELKDKYLRLYSEFDNFRRRNAKERLDLIKTANEDLMKVIFPILDDFERAQNAFPKENNPESIKEGVTLIYHKLVRTLDQKGLKPMEIAKGTNFDPDLHESIAQMPVEDQNLKGKIVDVVEKGYYLNEKVVRFAKVVIGS